ncbi:MAG: hydroxychlorobactene glucosyltransferase CruC [Candidatus Kapaibacteriales bacterium]
MTDTVLYILVLLSLGSNLLFSLVVVYNYVSNIWANKNKNKNQTLIVKPKISVLIPARNESENLKRNLPSILSQRYKDLNILVMDDDSSDPTPDTLDVFKSQYSNFHGYSQNELPKEWKGKVYALHRLSEIEKDTINSEVLLFTDADDYFFGGAIETSLKVMKRNNLDMISFFPGQEFASLAERLFSPISDLILFTLLPLKLVEKTSNPSISAANGQWIMITRDAYEKIGGHESVRNSLLDDTDIARRAKTKGLKTGVYSGIGIVKTRMYSSFISIVNGFAKNIYPIFGSNIFIALPAASLYLFSGVQFVLFLFINSVDERIIYFNLLLLSISFMYFWRLLIGERLKHPFVSIILYPITSMFIFFIALKSYAQTKKRRNIWKGRYV